VSTTHYQRLGVAPTATQAEIRAAYRELARRHHPDVSDADANTAMVAVNEAWYVLRDPARRAAYDASVRPAPPKPAPPRPGPGRAPTPSPESAAPAADAPPPRPSWWNEPLTDDPRLDLPITDGRAVRTFGFLVAIAASLAIAALTALFAYAILWSN
jgi:curved DNA-binding protein CbpA